MKKSTQVAKSSKRYYPNCWGRQAYANNYREPRFRENIDLNNITQKKGWIQAHVARYFEGIQFRSLRERIFRKLHAG